LGNFHVDDYIVLSNNLRPNTRSDSIIGLDKGKCNEKHGSIDEQL
jgi:hypothetical protein